MTDKKSAFEHPISYDGYFSLRNKINKRPGEDLVYDVVLGVFNRPDVSDQSKTRFRITREELTKQMERLVGRVIGEVLTGDLISSNGPYKFVDEYIKRVTQIDISVGAGVLLDYEVSAIRDARGAFVVTGGVRVTENAAKLLDDGTSIFTIRSLIKDTSDVVELVGFDLLPIHKFDITK